MKKQAAKKTKLISIAKSEINKMTKSQVLKQLAKAEYAKVFTDATWRNLDKRLMEL